MIEDIKLAVDKINLQLKGFQSASVDYVLKQLYEVDRRKVLVADEVGLGKTIIAKGVIANAILHYKPKDRPFHVVYICSNQVLAQQNITKLSPFGIADKPLSRLVFLAFKENENQSEILKLSSLTPSTSFQLTNSVGVVEERAMLFCFFRRDPEFNYGENVLSKLLQTKMIGKESWESKTNNFTDNYDELFKPEIAELFLEQLKSVPFSKERCKKVYHLLDKECATVYDAIKELVLKLSLDESIDPMGFSYEIIKVLRNELTYVCLKYLDADLFILDEFQRFNSLLNGDSESEAGEIAKSVLRNDEARVLLLSATPFKPFTTQLEQLNGESHFDEFRKIIEFLGGSKGQDLWKDFRKDQEAFFSILRHPIEAILHPEVAIEKKKNLENNFKKFLTRNERLSVAKEYNNMTEESSNETFDVIKDDVENFIALDQLVSKLMKTNDLNLNRFGSTLEFCKSAPYPLSFLHGYKLKETIEESIEDPIIAAHLAQNTAAWIDYKKIDKYEALGYHESKPTFPNGKLRMLADECFKEQGELLLWVPPSKPYYKTEGVYNNAKNFSKLLVFSSWKMAPRAIASLISYEVERRTIAKSNTAEGSQQKSEFNYFSIPRKPAPLLVYKTAEKDEKTIYHMSNFTLSYPSISLSEISIINSLTTFQDSYDTIKKQQALLIRQLFDNLKVKDDYSIDSTKEDKTWYWISGALLDSIQNKNNECLEGKLVVDLQEDGNGFEKHKENLNEIVVQLKNGYLKLGKFPSDLFEVLSDITLSSPGICVLNSLRNHFKNDKGIEKYAFQIANSFFSLFNKPESISAIRLSIAEHSDFWRKTLCYCAEGNFLSMVDEYIYMMKNCNSIQSVDKLVDQMHNVLSVRTSSVGVDLKTDNARYETFNMRTHFAVSYGEQKMGTDAGNNRMINVRDVFNSPFRPFVLASTSVGQEGLDFHFYCRKIVHWNLPHNAIDLEQREGRINRFKAFVIRKKIAELIPDDLILKSYTNHRQTIWESIFENAEEQYKEDKSGMKPFWYLDEGSANIERFVPIHKFSKDHQKYDQLKVTLALYRMTFGQPRQEELINALKKSNLTKAQIDSLRKLLLINLSPM